MTNLNEAKILLFYPFGATKHYGDSIKAELIRRGAFVIGYDERPSQNSIIKVIIRLFKKKIPAIFSTYIYSIIKKNKDIDFNYILVLRGEAFTESAVELLKDTYKNATLILYLWDILKSTNLQEVIPFFDKVLSFDPDDVKNNNGVIFRPTFFMPQYENLSKNNYTKHGVTFIGTLHSNRYQLLNVLKKHLNKNQISFFFYLYIPSRLVFIKKKYINKILIHKKEVHFNPISLKNTLYIISDSKCILDLNFTGQKSLSMRAFEAMASMTKYITTNPEIEKYDFYNKRNILIIDVNNIDIPLDFINSPFEKIPPSILQRYSVKQLVDDILFLKK